jgi:hypothetical protein
MSQEKALNLPNYVIIVVLLISIFAQVNITNPTS